MQVSQEKKGSRYAEEITYDSPMGRSPRVVTALNMLRMVVIGGLCYLFITLTSCRAVKPVDIEVKTEVDTTVHSDSGEVNLNLDCEQLRKSYDSLAKSKPATVFIHDTEYVDKGWKKEPVITPKAAVLIHSDSIADIYYAVKANGQLAFKVKTKQQPIRLKYFTSQKIPVSCPVPTFWEMAKGVSWFIFVCVLAAVFVTLWATRRK